MRSVKFGKILYILVMIDYVGQAELCISFILRGAVEQIFFQIIAQTLFVVFARYNLIDGILNLVNVFADIRGLDNLLADGV